MNSRFILKKIVEWLTRFLRVPSFILEISDTENGVIGNIMLFLRLGSSQRDTGVKERNL